MMGADGLTRATQTAVLGANYPGTDWYERAYELARRLVEDHVAGARLQRDAHVVQLAQRVGGVRRHDPVAPALQHQHDLGDHTNLREY
mgnify:CR=1 FL=1